MDKNKLRQFPPCSIYETGKIERWLEDMAKEGWLFEEISTFWGYYLFKRSAPQAVHYRLEVVVNPQSFWSGDPKTPQEEALALHEEYGWEFILRHGEFFLYKSTEATPLELHTDPEIQALTLKMLNKRILGSAFSSALIIAFNILFGAYGYPFGIVMVMGSVFLLGLLAVTGFGLWRLYEAIHHTYRHRKALLRGTSDPQMPDWRSGAKHHRFLQITSMVLTACFTVYLFAICIARRTEVPLTEFSGTVPFVTLEELDPENRLDHIDNGTCSAWSDPLYPVIYDYLDGGAVNQGDELITGGLLEVQYCEAAAPWLALGAAKDFTRFYSWQVKIYRSNVEVRPLTGLGLDYAMGMYNQFGLIRVVLAEGDRAICARFSLDDKTGLYTIENWTELMTQKLLAESGG